jgi:DNA-binding PadR family transcriptional regulator
MFGQFFGGGHAWHRHRGRGFGPFGGLGREWAEAFGRGGPGPRVDRGDVKLLILSVLREGPRHGYEIMRAIEQRSGGAYSPSPGVVYPTLQMLEDLGHVQAREGAERKVYELTEAGRAYLAENQATEQEAWGRFESQPWRDLFPSFGSEEQRQVRDELLGLAGALFAGGRLMRADATRLTRLRDILRSTRQQVDAVFTDYV